ncbi:MAG: ATP-binding protein [Clostridia bacterium]|nr:ATP-binding protein [Clostridia bacterium]
MSFSKDYLYSRFEDSYNKGLKAKSMGDMAEAKRCLGEAASYMEMLARTSSGEDKAERMNRAARLRAVAQAIKVPERRGAPAAGGNTYGAPTYNNTPAYDTGTAGDGGAVEEDMQAYFSFFGADELEFGFEGVIGLDSAKHAVTEYVINPIRYPEAYHYQFADNKAVLLEGPPGTGKTTFAKAVAKEVSQPFVLVNVAALVNCYVGETGKNIDKVFAWLRRYTEENRCGITVFFDELDEIAKRRDGDDKASASAVPALLRNMDGVKRNKGFLILANTNCPEMLDAGILDRFRKRIHIPLPDEGMRRHFFKSKLSEVEPEFLEKLDLDAFAAASEGLSGRSITYICDDFKYALSAVQAGIRREDDLSAVMIGLIEESKRSC